ncbi:FecR family protein [Chitinophaga lutea]|uniref:FecR family protein n=1 Tax=Chitinophaga lutea TaxID=2488634 RepID=A0A3N4PQM1_9BACT|nr:FecR family protein [Chitinophaga lutea]RPE09029.1 FecR family protein [Chitinophaga lutea]
MSQHNELFGNDEPLESGVREIVSAAGNESMKPEDKAALWERIQSGFTHQPSVFRIGWKVAAAVLVLIAAGWWLLQPRPSESGVLTFARNQTVKDSSTETRLLLSNNQQVTLSDTSASLTYSRNGTQVSVNDRQQYEQEGQEGQYNTLIVPYGRRARVQLQDGSVVWLNAGSRLVYPMMFSEKSREVFLEGEGYFDVTANEQQPFFVYTSHLKTAVLGTEFNINAYADEDNETVVLAKGSVKVKTNKGNAERLLAPGNLAGYAIATQNMYQENVNILAYTAWKDGRLMFEQAPLNHILKKLSRYFNVAITSETNLKSTFSGDLDLSEDIRDVMEAVSVSTGLSFKKTEQGFVFEN